MQKKDVLKLVKLSTFAVLGSALTGVVAGVASKSGEYAEASALVEMPPKEKTGLEPIKGDSSSKNPYKQLRSALLVEMAYKTDEVLFQKQSEAYACLNRLVLKEKPQAEDYYIVWEKMAALTQYRLQTLKTAHPHLVSKAKFSNAQPKAQQYERE